MTGREQHAAPVGVRLRVGGLELESGLELRLRRLQAAGPGQRRGEVEVGVEVVWFQAQRLLQVGDALRIPPGAGQRIAEIILGLREVRIEPHGLLVMGDRFRRAL